MPEVKEQHYDQQRQKLSQVNFETLWVLDNFKILYLTVLNTTIQQGRNNLCIKYFKKARLTRLEGALLLHLHICSNATDLAMAWVSCRNSGLKMPSQKHEHRFNSHQLPMLQNPTPKYHFSVKCHYSHQNQLQHLHQEFPDLNCGNG